MDEGGWRDVSMGDARYRTEATVEDVIKKILKIRPALTESNVDNGV